MKGIVFTLDALFALMIAAAGISILLYFVYSAPTPAVIQSSTSSFLINEMAGTKLSTISGIPLVSAIVNQSLASNQTWYQEYEDASGSNGNQYGPSLNNVEYVVNVPSQIINGSIVAGYGNIYFGAGNVIYAVNASTGQIVWQSPTLPNANWALSVGPYSTFVNSTLLTNGKLIYADYANVVALSAYNGSLLWTANTVYQGAGALEPEGDEYRMHLMGYDNKIYTTQFESESEDTPLYAMYANNGTYIAQSSTMKTADAKFDNPVSFMAITNDGGILADVPAAHAHHPGLYLTTDIFNSTYAGGSIWSQAPFASGTVTNIATSGNVIILGEARKAVLYSTQGVLIASPSLPGSAVDGVSSYAGRYAIQSTTGTSMYSSSGSKDWGISAPAIVGNGALNATPVQSNKNIYTAWSNGYVAEQNQSTGAFMQYVNVPFSGLSQMDPQPILAYGKLFVGSGNNIVAFGTCQAAQNSSILSAIATMYINNEGSCADYILNSLQGAQNTTFTINNQSAMTVPYFSGVPTSNIIIPYSSSLNIRNSFTFSTWLYSSVPASTVDYESDIISPTDVGHTDGINMLVIQNNGAFPDVVVQAYIYNNAGSLIANPYAYYDMPSNTWANLVLTMAPTQYTLYVNGQSVASGNYGANSNPVFMSSASAASGINLDVGGGPAWQPVQGSIANMQVYNSTLTGSQVGLLYREGLSGPPVAPASIVEWFPFAGDANGYGKPNIPGFASGVTFGSATYNSTGLRNSYSVTSQSATLPLLNYTTGLYRLYNVGIYTWK